MDTADQTVLKLRMTLVLYIVLRNLEEDYVIIPDEWEEIGDYMDTFYAFCGECHEEIYQGKHESSLIEHLKETGQLVEV